MADRQVRPAADGIGESLTHLIVAAAVVTLVYLLAGVIADLTITVVRYFTG